MQASAKHTKINEGLTRSAKRLSFLLVLNNANWNSSYICAEGTNRNRRAASGPITSFIMTQHHLQAETRRFFKSWRAQLTLLIRPSSMTALLIFLNSSYSASTSLTLTARGERREREREKRRCQSILTPTAPPPCVRNGTERNDERRSKGRGRSAGWEGGGGAYRRSPSRGPGGPRAPAAA